MSLGFHYRAGVWRLRSAGRHRLWLEAVLKREKKATGQISYIFTDNDEIRSINREFLNHDYDTDVITFDYSSVENIKGEIYISIDTVRENAKELAVSLNEEVRRVLVHAILHLCGYDDADEANVREMRRLEDMYLKYYRDEFRI